MSKKEYKTPKVEFEMLETKEGLMDFTSNPEDNTAQTTINDFEDSNQW